jgi:hypothetical protein
MHKLPFEFAAVRSSGEKCTFTVRCCVPEDLEEIVGLQDKVSASIAQKDLFVMTKKEEFLESLKIDYCICADCGGIMTAFSLMVLPRDSYRNYGTYLDYSKERMASCVSFDTTFVLPDFRGFRLQKLFFDLREEYAREIGAGEELSTISPDNSYSLSNARASGFETVMTHTIYHGLDRCIMRKIIS